MKRERAKSILSFSSESLLQQAIARLFCRMPGISDVQILQGSLELGKDIVFYTQGGLGEPILCACVVKNKRITGNVADSAGARTVYLQAEQAFDSTHIDGFGKETRVERVYIVTPYDLTPSTIASISGKLKDKPGKVTLIGGSKLFDLFKKYWPDFLADEASMIEQHLSQTKQLYEQGNPLPSLAFQYSLGAVSSESVSVYVTQSFHREIRGYRLGELTSLPAPTVLHKKLSRDSILKIQKSFGNFDLCLDYLNDWGLCDPHYDRYVLRERIDTFIAELLTEWQKNFDTSLSQGKIDRYENEVNLVDP